MKTRFICTVILLTVAASQCAVALADTRADAHAPIGVMADHVHKKGEWMLSYRYMTMEMQNNLQGSHSIDPDTIVTTEPNRFFGMAGQPPTLRIVPLDMRMDMHMLGGMFAISDRITLMLMAARWEKSMHHLTYMGGMGTAQLGSFDLKTSGWGDTSAMALVSLHHSATAKVHAIIGLSLPTGGTNKSGEILTPMNTRPVIRAAYPMQLGSGSYDPILGISYSGFGQHTGWGAQWQSTFRLGHNSDDYSLGDEHHLTGWFSVLFSDSVSVSARLAYFKRGNLSGQDPGIVGPVQTADPDRQGQRRVDWALGVNLAAQGTLTGWRLGVEYAAPLYQDVDGPQLETDHQLTIGLQKSFE